MSLKSQSALPAALPWRCVSVVYKSGSWSPSQKKKKKLYIGQWQIWRLNYFRDNLYDFPRERSWKRRAVKASQQPWLGHADIDSTEKTGAGELWCHDSVLSLPLSLKRNEELRRERKEGMGKTMGWGRRLEKTLVDKADELNALA